MTAEQQKRYDAALAYACTKHNGQYRKGGEPYIIHPIAVANTVRDWGEDIDYQIVGLFHDLLEDTDATEEEILNLGGEEVLHAVKLLTKVQDYVMDEYVAGIKSDYMDSVVKAADRLHNLRSAEKLGDEFKRRYLWETVDFYLDLPHGEDIIEEAKKLRRTMDRQMTDLPMTYKPIPRGEWKMD